MPRTKKQLNELKTKRYNKIVDTSLRLFAISGYKAVSIDDIAKANNCAHSLIYHYFKTKEDVFLAVIDKVKKEMCKLVDSVNYDTSPSESIRSLLSNLLDALKVKKPDMAAMIYLVLNLHLQRDGLPKPKDNDKQHHIWQVLISLIKKGQESGEFNEGDPVQYTIALVTMLQGLAYKSMHMKKEIFITPSVDIIMNMIKKERS